MPNQATNFLEAMAENLETVFLGQGHFEEQVTWLETVTGPGVTFVVLPYDVRGKLETESHHLADQRHFGCVIPKNPVVIDGDGNRVSWSDLYEKPFDPRLGNSIQRSDGTVWGFSRIDDEDPVAWSIVFVGGRIEKARAARPPSL